MHHFEIRVLWQINPFFKPTASYFDSFELHEMCKHLAKAMTIFYHDGFLGQLYAYVKCKAVKRLHFLQYACVRNTKTALYKAV